MIAKAKAKANVLLTYQKVWLIDEELPLYKELSSQVNFIKYKITTKDDFKKFLTNNDINAWWINEEVFELLGNPNDYWDYFPESLRVILVPWVGCEFISGKNLWKEKKILLCNIGDKAVSNVSELAILLIISCFRMTTSLEYCFRFLENGDINNCKKYFGSGPSTDKTAWKNELTGEIIEIQKPNKAEYLSNTPEEVFNLHEKFTMMGKEVDSPTNKNVLILGFGSIGQYLGKRIYEAFHMNISYYKRSGPVHADLLSYPAKYFSSLDDPQTWSAADVIVLILPANKESDEIICSRTLNMCKKGVRIVNVGRGTCINENDLIDALNSGQVASCGLDVYKDETKPIQKALMERLDVTLLPHLGSEVKDIFERQTVATLENIQDIFIRNGNGKYTLNFPPS